jgi:hypothetical protein
MSGRFEFIGDVRVVQVGPNCTREITGKGEGEGENVLTGFHGVVV